MLYLLYALLILFALAAGSLFIAWRMMVWMPGRSYRGTPPPLNQREEEIQDALERDLTMLADDIGIRELAEHYVQLIDAAFFIEQSLRDAGYEPRRQEFEVEGRAVWNIEVEIAGTTEPDKILVVGSHYDTIRISPGANDNGSAVVANLALARALAKSKPKRTIRFVFFVNEEAPYYGTEAMGSLRCAERCQANSENIIGMICLETIGYYSDEPNSQRYPISLLGKLYPTTGNFITVVGNVRSRRLVRQVTGGLRRSPFPAEGIAAPRWLKDIFRSDHAAFWRCGYPALMLTDGANFRYDYYHTPEDTVDKVDFPALARLVTAIERMLREQIGDDG